ncbi:uncharacterized protein BXZ73DRAFT_44256 [Epithele typhae]|uniref:uncharacterized protein n=1 Tax=Epithele typhae TaxID=378194 RepID=UPI0020085099|nr:uncharacterized protein BXZ73DRAFT_44256 [Epithele typhae]KAH9939092.1 hypothetical protein BXZ73DRAFT_44256 [Epithele typhae]
MAQPLFDQHPLEDYFRNTGETAEPMPGSSPDFMIEDDPVDAYSSEAEVHLPPLVQNVLEIARELLHPSDSSSQENTFAERFKYDVISSSLLSSSLAASLASPVSARRANTPEIPGRLSEEGTSGGGGEQPVPTPAVALPDIPSLPAFSGPQLAVTLLSVSVLVFSIGFYFLAFVVLLAALYAWCAVHTDPDKCNYTTETANALNELISAGNFWDSAVNEAVMLIETEERSVFYGAPSSSLRIALQSSLYTTQMQCDNVRQLLSALAAPSTVSQLAEMYAPPSPVRPALVLSDHPRSPSSPSGSLRPFSHPSASQRTRTISLPNSNSNKRSTWNGSYATLAMAGSPTAHLVNRKKRNRRTDVISLFQPMPTRGSLVASVSAPVSPHAPSPEPKPQLEVLAEEELAEDELEDKSYFGAAALDLQRKRKSTALEVFDAVPPPSYTPPRSSGSDMPVSPTFSSSSRLTPMHTNRHPLSLSGLHLSLQAALSSKRYACSHLLALRFAEDEDETYWEDVRSLMALLCSTFSDASARLMEALNEVDKRRIKDEHPTPPRGNTPTPQGKSGHQRRASPLHHSYVPARSVAEMSGFAPVPSNLTRLATHVDAISGALNEAREHLEECISAIRDAPAPGSSEIGTPSVQDHPAFQAYDRLRKELGYALRECERGRERLLDIIADPRPSVDSAEDDDASPNTPGLGNDSGSESSERQPISPRAAVGLGLSLALGREGPEEGEQEVDDATSHLLLSTSTQHLPPPGAEQVFEADAGNIGAFARPRSKLSREERIEIMKARRASGVPLGIASLPSPLFDGAGRVDDMGRERDRWGPGGEVVQELKDVIWKVGEKRRRMSQQVTPTPTMLPLPPLPPPSSKRVSAPPLSFATAPPRVAVLGSDSPVNLSYAADVFDHHPPSAHDREPIRETSVSIAVDEGSPEDELDAFDLEATPDSPTGSSLAYLDDVDDDPLAVDDGLRTAHAPPPDPFLPRREECVS